MDIALRLLMRRLDDQLLEHLRAHCAEQAARIDELEAQVERLRNEAIDADGRADMWHNLVNRLQDDMDPPAHVGITTDGSIVVLPPEPTAPDARVLS